MKLEAGKRYILRNNTVTGPLALVEPKWTKDYLLECPVNRVQYDPFDEELGHTFYGTEEEHYLDIVGEYK